jgi:hypothetical protein
LKDLDVSETEKETEVSDQDGRSCTVLDVVSCVNNGQESNLVSSQSQVCACTEYKAAMEGLICFSSLCFFSPIHATWPTHLILLGLIILIILGEEYKPRRSSLFNINNPTDTNILY